jgi:predicted metal-dependent phosphoesterase TrpH
VWDPNVRVLHADLHIHTCLSPCADSDMRPSTVVQRALEKGLDVIAICDHNSAENVEAVSRAAEGAGLAVIGGMEFTSREEVHVLGLFDDRGSLREAQDVVYDNLPGENDPDTFGEQWVMDEHDEVTGHNRRLLIGATTLTLDEVVQTIHRLGGIAVASHVDRPSFSVLSQLGFIPDGLGLDGVEVCSERVPAVPPGMVAISSSDAHRPEEIGARSTRFLLERPTTEEIGLALHQRKGRRALEQ